MNRGTENIAMRANRHSAHVLTGVIIFTGAFVYLRQALGCLFSMTLGSGDQGTSLKGAAMWCFFGFCCASPGKIHWTRTDMNVRRCHVQPTLFCHSEHDLVNWHELGISCVAAGPAGIVPEVYQEDVLLTGCVCVPAVAQSCMEPKQDDLTNLVADIISTAVDLANEAGTGEEARNWEESFNKVGNTITAKHNRQSNGMSIAGIGYRANEHPVGTGVFALTTPAMETCEKSPAATIMPKDPQCSITTAANPVQPAPNASVETKSIKIVEQITAVYLGSGSALLLPPASPAANFATNAEPAIELTIIDDSNRTAAIPTSTAWTTRTVSLTAAVHATSTTVVKTSTISTSFTASSSEQHPDTTTTLLPPTPTNPPAAATTYCYNAAEQALEVCPSAAVAAAHHGGDGLAEGKAAFGAVVALVAAMVLF